MAPFELAGVMHADASIARNIARQCLQQYAAGTADTEHHRMSSKFLHPSSSLHAMLVEFTDGCSMQHPALEGLYAEWAPWGFIRVVEHSVEKASRAWTHGHTACYAQC